MTQIKQASVISNYIPALDGLRAIAVLLVVLGHYAGTLKIPTTILENHLVYRFLASAAIGVDLFFVISGFLITSLLLEVRARDGSMKSFWMRRILRIAPLFIFYLVFLVVLPHIADVEFLKLSSFSAIEWIGIFAYLANIVFLFHGKVSQEYVILWSLSIEEQFYLTWPFLIKTLEFKDLRRFIVLAISLAFAFRFGSYLYSPKVDAHYFLLFCRMDGLLFGALIAFFRTYGEFEIARRWIARWGWLFAVLMLLYLLQEKPYYQEIKGAFYIGYFYFVVALSWAIIVLHAIEAPVWTERILANRVARYIGKISYGLYIWHPIVGKVTDYHLDGFGFEEEAYATRMTIMLSLSFVAATLSFYTIETGFLKLKKHFPYFSDETTAKRNEGAKQKE